MHACSPLPALVPTIMSPLIHPLITVTFGSMEWKGWVCLGIVAVGFVCMLLELTGPDFIMLGMLSVMVRPAGAPALQLPPPPP